MSELANETSIELLKAQITRLQDDLERGNELSKKLAERAEVRLSNLEKDYGETKQRINKAEMFGRALIWSTIILGGFLSQFKTLLAAIKKLGE